MKMARTWLWLLVTITGLIEIGGCNSNSTNPYSNPSTNNSGTNTNASPNTVVVYNMSFGPTTLTVQRGATVTWQNNDAIVHTATSDTGAWDSGNISAGGSKSVTFNTVGTFPYHCTVHPMMTGTIVVQ
jgi:plastocyanin